MKKLFPWTEDNNLAKLREMWTAGLTGSQIAKELGTTRNSVIGKAHRLELEAREPPASLKRKPKPVIPLSVEIERMHGDTGGGTTQRIAARRSASSKPLPSYKPPAEYPGSMGIDILALDLWTCRWPFGEGGAQPFTFCGRPAEKPWESPYCFHHNQQAYNKLGRAVDKTSRFSVQVAVRAE